MRNISFALTTPQFLDGTKDVTRRVGWLDLRPGLELCGVEKGQGLGKGGKVKRLGVIRVVAVRQEKLRRMVDEPEYGALECAREGFPNLKPQEFVHFFVTGHKGCTAESWVTRIEFVKVAPPPTSLAGDRHG